MKKFLNPDEWCRKGRGKGFEFDINDSELTFLLERSLPVQYKPYHLFVLSMKENAGEYHPHLRKIDMKDMPEYQAKGEWHYFIVSAVLTDISKIEQPSSNSHTLPINGAINLQTGRSRKQKPILPSLGLVDKLMNINTGEIIVHEDYLRIYNMLRKTIKKFEKLRSHMTEAS